ncbi:MAG TPA: hypothetical protein VEQ60_14390 [Longimicrobium sp.]|nr:hypothetical protein [Longimicrobium sp.]
MAYRLHSAWHVAHCDAGQSAGSIVPLSAATVPRAGIGCWAWNDSTCSASMDNLSFRTVVSSRFRV